MESNLAWTLENKTPHPLATSSSNFGLWGEGVFDHKSPLKKEKCLFSHKKGDWDNNLWIYSTKDKGSATSN